MTGWVRLWHDMPTDPKWRSIARKAGQPLPCVIAIFNLIMVNASANSDNRGTLRNWDDEDAASALDIETEAVTAIMQAMQGKVIDGARVTGWEKRQPKREDDGTASRKRAQRERDNASAADESHIVTQCHAPETETDTETKAEKKTDSRSVAKATRPYASRFDEFWQAYPRRDGPNPRKPAEQRFNSLVKSGVDPQMLIDEARALCEAERKRGNIGTRFIPQAVTWLNQQRWSDHAAVAMVQLLAATATLSKKFHVKSDTPQWDAWVQHLGRAPPQDKDFGWYFDSEWPPADPKQPSTHHEGRA